MADLDKKATTVAGQPTGDTTESGNPSHNADGTFGSKGGGGTVDSSSLKPKLSFADFLSSYQSSEEDDLLDNFDLDSINKYKDVEEMSDGELATEIKSHREFLSNHFDLYNFGINAFNGDLKLQCSNFRQLKSLVEKYPFTTFRKPSLEMNSRLDRTIARTGARAYRDHINNYRKYPFEVITIQFNTERYSSYEKRKDSESISILSNWSMPCEEKNYANYSLTHEYGHLLSYEILNKRDALLGVDIRRDISESFKKMKNEIVKIFNEQNNYNEPYKNYISDYGQSDSGEFFAEVFANLNCGKPNKLAKAMEEWLRRNGGMK